MRIALIAPNISENMAGEAIKAFQYIRRLREIGAELTVITHERSKGQFEDATDTHDAIYVEDEFFQLFFYHSKVFRPFVHSVFFLKVRDIVRKMADEHPETVFHYLIPVSPIQPRFPLKDVTNVLGPLTGNIYFPEALRQKEPYGLTWRRLLHWPLQKTVGSVAGEKSRYQKILVSGGERTRQSLVWGGADADILSDVIDSGISDRILGRPPLTHEGTNHHFVCNGRMVPHKGMDLAIRAVARAKEPITLDIFGKGPEEEKLRSLITELGLEDRVTMRGWLPSHDDLLDEMQRYRGFVFPSMAEANGIVVQEALAMALPVVCLNWGGPTMLTTPKTAVQIAPDTEEKVVADIAAALDRLAVDADYANTVASAGYEEARRDFSWRAVADQWISAFADKMPADDAAMDLKKSA